MRGRTTQLTLRRVAVAAVAMLAVTACSSKGDSGDGECLSNEQFFKEQVYANILAPNCMQCHTDQGAAKDSHYILKGPEWGPDYLEQNYNVWEGLARLEYDGQPWILLKPTNQVSHTGGERFAVDSPEYNAFVEMIERIDNPVQCEEESDDVDTFFAGVEMLDEVGTLRKASLGLVGRMPTIEEEERVRDGGWEAFDVVLDEMMREDAFFVRLKEIYNDYFLTDRYYNNLDAIDLLDLELYPNAYWFDAEADPDTAGNLANKAVARESIELVAHVVKNDLPYSEILTADYTMVNSYSAKTFGIEFGGSGEYGDFQPAQIPGVPHVGVLSSVVFLRRFPTTPTNRNRHRARMVYDFFLATDVLALGDRPVDASSIIDHNPTMNNPQCVICHAVIDPVAGTLQNFDEFGNYAPIEGGWFTDMRPPGFGDTAMPPELTSTGANWLMEQVVADPRFPLSAVHIMFKGLAGQDPLKIPSDPKEPGYLEGIRAADMQTAIFDDIATKFVEGNLNLKVVIKEVVKTPYYRAVNAETLDETRQAELAKLGTGRLVIPEQLARKILAVTGIPWRPDVAQEDYVTDIDWYRIFYGGIDSDTVVERITEPNGIMANVAKRMSNEMACDVTALDFAKAPGDRFLFPYVEPSFQPEDDNGFEVPAAAQAIRANIQHLHFRLLGEDLDLNDEEINRTYELFLKVWKEGQRGMSTLGADGMSMEYGTNLGACAATQDYFTGGELGEFAVTEDPNYTIRAWMAVMAYMLSDYRFLHE